MKKLLSVIFALAILVTAVCAAPLASVADDPSPTPVGYQLIYRGSLGNANEVAVDTSKIFFDILGDNLITDPKVSAFDGEGNYLEYYDATKFATEDPDPALVNPEAWWDRPAIKYNGFVTTETAKMFTSAKYSGYVLNDATLSHTADGSGVIRVTGTRKSQFLPLPKLEKYSYYMITFWVKSSAADGGKNINILRRANDEQGVTYANGSGNGYISRINYCGYLNIHTDKINKWNRFSFMIYTGNVAWDQPAISIPGGDNASVKYDFDDFGVYKIRDDYGAAIVTDRANAENMESYYSDILGVAPYGTDKSGINLNADYNSAYENVDWSKYGENVCPDSTVNCFTNGVYNDYFAGNYANSITNENAIWDKPANAYQASVSSNNWYSPSDKGYVTSDTSYSHTADGSGAIIIGTKGNFYLPLPAMERYHYYAITLWLKNPEEAWTALELNRNTNPYAGEPKFQTGPATSSENDYWSRVTFLVYTGNSVFSEPNIKFYGLQNAIVDDIEMWKITDPSFGRMCLDNSKLVMRGDFDSNIALDATDMDVLKGEIVNKEYLSAWVSDVNGDGVNDVRDFVNLKKMCIPA